MSWLVSPSFPPLKGALDHSGIFFTRVTQRVNGVLPFTKSYRFILYFNHHHTPIGMKFHYSPDFVLSNLHLLHHWYYGLWHIYEHWTWSSTCAVQQKHNVGLLGFSARLVCRVICKEYKYINVKSVIINLRNCLMIRSERSVNHGKQSKCSDQARGKFLAVFRAKFQKFPKIVIFLSVV